MAQEERKIIKIGGVPMHIVLGKTHQEWKEKYIGVFNQKQKILKKC